VTQICGDSLANIGGQRHLGGPTSFAVNGHLADVPIDIFQVERNDFSGPQAQPGEQHQNCVVAPADGRSPITPTQYALDRSWWKKSGQCGLRPIRHSGHARRQIHYDVSAVLEVATKGAECCHQQFGSSRAELMSMTPHKPGNVGDTKRAKVQSLVAKALRKELINEGYIILQRRPGQPPLFQQITAKLIGDALPRAPYRQTLALLHHSGLAQHGKESIQYAGVASADSCLPLMMPHESIHCPAIQISQLDMFVLKPSTEIGDHHDLISDRVPRIALLGDGGCVCVQVPTQRPLAQPFNRAWKSEKLFYHPSRMPT
jgi:hypothetical protein